jgi:GTP-binding protein
MNIKSAKFIKGIVGPDAVLEDGIPQVAFIGRSNVGKSSIINSLTNQKNLAKTSSFPGRTQEINIFLLNESLYLVDLPGYGYAKTSRENQENVQRLINWYLFESQYEQKIVIFIIDANIGPTKIDIEMLSDLEARKKNIIIVANKIDKIQRSIYKKQMKNIQDKIGHHRVIPCSAEKKIGIGEISSELFNEQ